MENNSTEDQKLEQSIINSPSEVDSKTTPEAASSEESKGNNILTAGKRLLEKTNNQSIDKELQPLSLLQSMLFIIILAIPLINIIFLLRWSFLKGVNRNKKNLARAFLVIAVLSFVFYYVGQQMLGS